MNLAERAATAWREQVAKYEAEAVAGRRAALEAAAQAADATDREAFVATAELRRDAAAVFAEVLGEITDPDAWAPRPGVTSAVWIELEGLEFAVVRTTGTAGDQLHLKFRRAGSDAAFVPVHDLASLGAAFEKESDR